MLGVWYKLVEFGAKKSSVKLARPNQTETELGFPPWRQPRGKS